MFQLPVLPLFLRRPGPGALLALAALAGCTKARQETVRQSAPPPVVVTKVVRKVVPLALDAIGAVEPSRTAAVRSQVTGTLLRIDFTEGSEVKEGDLMFEVDPRPFRNAVAAAEADLQKVEAQLDNARSQVKRYQSLSAGEMVSKEQFQTILDNERAISAQVLSTQSALANARLQLEYCSIRAPISGRTGALGAHEGDLVRASDANVSLVTINRLSPIDVSFSVPQEYLGQLARSRARGPVKATALPPGPDARAEQGELVFVDNAVDTTTGTVRLKATFPNEDAGLWPGQFVNVTVILANPEATVVPAAALQTDQKGQHVFVVRADKKAEYRIVTVERTVSNETVIAQGLAPGEVVIVDGQLRVLPEREVDIKPPPGPPGSSNPVAMERATGEVPR